MLELNLHSDTELLDVKRAAGPVNAYLLSHSTCLLRTEGVAGGRATAVRNRHVGHACESKFREARRHQLAALGVIRSYHVAEPGSTIRPARWDRARSGFNPNLKRGLSATCFGPLPDACSAHPAYRDVVVNDRETLMRLTRVAGHLPLSSQRREDGPHKR